MSEPFSWPAGKRAALSLTFDDARPSQVDQGLPILDAHGVKATFYVTPSNVAKRLEGWKRAVSNGHEIGNHTLSHPCSGNFAFARSKALEDYALDRMEAELTGANDAIKRELGVRPRTFAYPCGQKFVGRGRGVMSYVPLVAKHFIAGRGFNDEGANAPMFCDLAQLYGMDSDGRNFAQLKARIAAPMNERGWLIFASHEVSDSPAGQTLPARALDQLCAYAADPANGLWMDTVETIARYVQGKATLAPRP